MTRVEYERMLRTVWDRYRAGKSALWLERAINAVNRAHDKPTKKNLRKVEPYVNETPQQPLDKAPPRRSKGSRVRGKPRVEPLADGASGG